MSTAKTVIGFNDNLDSRVQDLAPTQYALGKMRAARTPYAADGTTVLNDPNRILRPGLYLMELNGDSKNTANMKSGVVYIYQYSADPDNSLHGGHVVEDTTTATMAIRQVGYFHNNGVEKVMTRVGSPDSSQYYAVNKVQLLKNIGDRTTGVTFVVELGMWVRHYVNVSNEFVIEPAVIWSEWHEINGNGSSGGSDYTFDTSFTNGVGLVGLTSTMYAARANLADINSAGTVVVSDNVISTTSRYVVPNMQAVYNAITVVSNNIMAVSGNANRASATASTASNLADNVSATLSNHINNGHPTVVNPATYTTTNSSVGTVYTTPTIASMSETLSKHKYTVPTVNAVYNASKNLSNAITAVSAVVSDHIAHDSAGLIEDVGFPFKIVEDESAVLSMMYDSAIYGGIQFTSTVDDEGIPQLAIVGRPATSESLGVVVATPTIASYSHTLIHDGPISGYIDEYTIPTMNALYNASSSISSRISDLSTNLGYGIVAVSRTLTNNIDLVSANVATVSDDIIAHIDTTSLSLANYIADTSTGLRMQIDRISGDLFNASSALQSAIDHKPSGEGGMVGIAPLYSTGADNMSMAISAATINTYGAVMVADTVVENDTTHVPTGAAVYTAIEEHGGGGSYDGIVIQAVADPLYMSMDEVSTLKIATALANEGPGIVKITDSVPVPDRTDVVPTAHAVYSTLLMTSQGSIAAPSYDNPWWSDGDVGGNVVYNGTAGAAGGWVMLSMRFTSNFQGCVGAQIGTNYIRVAGGGGPMCLTQLLPIPAGNIVRIYDGGATVSACGYGVTESSPD